MFATGEDPEAPGVRGGSGGSQQCHRSAGQHRQGDDQPEPLCVRHHPQAPR